MKQQNPPVADFVLLYGGLCNLTGGHFENRGENPGFCGSFPGIPQGIVGGSMVKMLINFLTLPK
jgi:hypothetical protein